MAPNAHCPECQWRTLRVVVQPDGTETMLHPKPDPDGTVYLTGDAWYGAWTAGEEPRRVPYAKEPANIPGHVALRYRRHICV